MADEIIVVENEEANRELLQCSRCGLVDQLQVVLEEGKANVNYADQNFFGYTGLMYASRNGHVECVKLLLDSKAAVDQQAEGGRTGLIGASQRGNVECLKLLLDSKANVDQHNQRGDTSLIFASSEGHVECVKLLLDAKANVDHQDQHGRTALNCASYCGHVRIAKLVLESAADVNIAAADGSTALSDCYGFSSDKPLLQFLLLCCGAEGEEGKEVLDEMKTKITTYHTELKKVLCEEVIVDTRLYLEEHGLYHEPLERVMEYCGLELMLENDPNRDEYDPIPQLLRDRPERVRSAWYWWTQFKMVLMPFY